MKDLNQMNLKGRFQVEHFNKEGKLLGVHEFPNGIVDVGLNFILDAMFNGTTPSTVWSIGLVDNAGFSGFADADTMASNPGWDENTDYSQATRPTWTSGAAASRSVTNAVTVDFSITVGAPILQGIFIVDNSTKGGITGTLWSTASFPSTVSTSDGDTLKITYTVSG